MAVPRAKISVQLFFVFRRSLSAVAAQQNPSSTQTGIPIVVAHHTIKKAFVVHPKSRAFQPTLKHQWLTKTILHQGLPHSYDQQEFNISSEETKQFVDIFNDSLIQQLAFQKELKKGKRIFDEEIKFGIFQNILRLCCEFSDRSPRLKESFLDVSPKIHTHWVRRHEFYNLIYHPDLVLWTSTPNAMAIYQEDVESTIEKSIPGPYDNYSQGLFQHPIVHLRNFPGYQPGSTNHFPHSHTLFLSDVSNQTTEQIHAYGIMSMFGVLASKAMSDGVLVGQHLPEPLMTQCIISNGKEAVLMCYQLNTLSLQEDHGIKNSAWGTEKMNFFISNHDEEADSLKRSVKLYGSFDAEKDLPDVNESFVKCLLPFICQ